MNQSAIRTQIREFLNDQSSIRFSDAQLNRYINLGNVDLMQRLNIDKATATVTSVVDTANYQLPSNISSLQEVYFDLGGTNNTRLTVISQDELNTRFGTTWKENPSGQPSVAFIADYNVIGFHPAPDSTNASRTITIYYYPIPSDLASDTASPIFINALHDALTMYSVSRGFDVLADIQRSAYYLKRYEEITRRFYSKAIGFSDDLMQWRWG